MSLYSELGGRDEFHQLRPGGWNLVFEGDLLVELDEQLHFNRYRAITLQSNWAAGLPWREAYGQYCRDRETKCFADGAWGRQWSNPSCEGMFGEGDKPSVLRHRGAPRWKQRALHDAIKDAFALTRSSSRVVRLAIYDEVEGVQLGPAVDRRVALDPETLITLVERRTAGAER